MCGLCVQVDKLQIGDGMDLFEIDLLIDVCILLEISISVCRDI